MPVALRAWWLSGLLLGISLQLRARVEACSCAPAHPQQLLCSASLVIRAKVVSEKVVPASANHDDGEKLIQYEIKQIKMFKGFDKMKDVQYVYTSYEPSLCGVTLEVDKKKHYLITGTILEDGKVFVNLCNYIVPWNDQSFLKKILNGGSQDDCACKIVPCYKTPCSISAPNECLWTDWLDERNLYGYQALHHTCVMRRDGTCNWYRFNSEKDSIDFSEP